MTINFQVVQLLPSKRRNKKLRMNNIETRILPGADRVGTPVCTGKQGNGDSILCFGCG